MRKVGALKEDLENLKLKVEEELEKRKDDD
jgi:hypothetical protein